MAAGMTGMAAGMVGPPLHLNINLDLRLIWGTSGVSDGVSIGVSVRVSVGVSNGVSFGASVGASVGASFEVIGMSSSSEDSIRSTLNRSFAIDSTAFLLNSDMF